MSVNYYKEHVEAVKKQLELLAQLNDLTVPELITESAAAQEPYHIRALILVKRLKAMGVQIG